MVKRIILGMTILLSTYVALEAVPIGSTAFAQADNGAQRPHAGTSLMTWACTLSPLIVVLLLLIPLVSRSQKKVAESLEIARRAESRGEEALRLQREMVELLKELVARRD